MQEAVCTMNTHAQGTVRTSHKMQTNSQSHFQVILSPVNFSACSHQSIIHYHVISLSTCPNFCLI